ncbi:MAG TPA: nuclease-related domain-containing protein [Methylophilus sp.]|uniref:nuclease-related domain-containing protein n=1 Tax=Methylophilus sp. TaxID=29541 RepID=UPI002BA7037D|nr:nuclease-related domain-containing protein [Methylophilus sp.]HSH87150.1 nuclease-related domain-containing protein [Methylophilus sp.]
MQETHLNLLTYVYLLLFLIVILFLKSARFKGHIGESLVKLNARLYLDMSIYHGVHNVTLETEDGTTQIDHIFVSKFGVFVVETKNYKGWIFGNERQSTWTQKLYKKTYKFQNPLRQNYKHLKALESILEVPSGILKPVIVFMGDSTFKTEMPNNVTYARGYTNYILSFNKPILDDAEVSRLLNIIKFKRLKPTFKTNRAHVKNLRARFNEKKS